MNAPPPKNILAAIQAEYICTAIRQLPDPETHEIQETILEVPFIGTVRFRARLFHYKRHKTTWKSWSVFEAFKIAEPPAPPRPVSAAEQD